MTIQRLMMVAFGLVISISGLPTALAKDLPDFTKFQLKIVMKSKNTSATPVISAIRAIAVV